MCQASEAGCQASEAGCQAGLAIFYTCLVCVVFIIILYIYWCYIRSSHYKKLYQKLKQFKGLKYSHSTNQPEELPQLKPINNTNCHMGRVRHLSLSII